MGETRYYLNGEIVPASKAMVSVNNRGFKYGDAAFETLRSYNGDPFAWCRHLDRLKRTCELLGMDHGLNDLTLRKAVDKTLAANGFENAYIRLTVTRGKHNGKLTPPETIDPTIVVVVSELPRGGTNGTSVWDGPATAEIVDTVRIPTEAIPATAKTHNYLNGILARQETDTDEALMLDWNGWLTEGATSNLFFCKDGVLKTPSLDGPILPGITREIVLELTKDRDIPSETGRYTPADLQHADEIFLTNTTWEIRPISRIGDIKLKPGPIAKELIDAFDTYVEATHY